MSHSQSLVNTPLVLLNNFQPVLYTLDLQVNHQKSNFNGQLTIDLSKDARTVPDKEDFEFTLHSSDLVILSATFSGSSGELKHAKVAYDRTNELAKFTIPDAKSLYNEPTLSLSIKYIGKINTIKTYRDFTKGVFKTNYLDDKTNTATNYVIATHCQASFARAIFPCVDEPVSKSSFKLSIETDPKFKVLSNTSVESQSINESSKSRKVLFEKTPIMNTSLFGFVIGDLDFIESKVTLKDKTIPLRLYTTIGNISGAAYSLDIAQQTLPFIESQFGIDFPLSKLDFIALPFLSDGAMENFGLVTIQSNHLLVNSLGNQEMNQSIRQLVVHEIIHHWVGNLVSFDEWDHLWLNESFTTWFAYYVLYKLELDPLDSLIWEVQADNEFRTLIDSNSSIDSLPILGSKKAKAIKSTQDAFEVHSYQKGIQFLRMLANVFESSEFNDDLPKFVKVLSDFVSEYKLKSIKPVDLWRFLSDHSKLDLMTFTQSWLRVPGIPIVSVAINSDDKIELVQHRFLYSSDAVTEQLEDVPYHIPLAIKLADGSVINQIFTDRRLVLQDIRVEEFVKLNSNRTGIYITQYNDLRLIGNITANIETLSTNDLIGLISDLSQVIGHDTHHSDIAVISIIKVFEHLINQKEISFVVLNHLLKELQIIQDSFKLFIDASHYSKFKAWLTSQNLKLFNKLKWNPEQYHKVSTSELQSRKAILSIGLETKEISTLSSGLFKNLLHGPSHSVPVEWLEPILSSTALTASTTTWKRILELAKQPGATISHVIGGDAADIQHASLGAIGYTKDPSLVKRVLNFVRDNIDSKMIELGLIGLQKNHGNNSQMLWDWFKLNYNQWATKSLAVASGSSAEMKKTLHGVSIAVFSGMNSEEEKNLVAEFVQNKLKTLPKHELEETLELVESSQLEKRRVSESFEAVLKHIV